MCQIRARLALVGPVLTRFECGPGHGSGRISDGALPLARGVQVDEGSALQHFLERPPVSQAACAAAIRSCMLCRDPRFGLSRICWRTSVAHHPTQDSAAAILTCDNSLYEELQGHALRARQAASLGEALNMRRGSPGPGSGIDREARCRGQGWRGTRRCWAAAWPAASCAAAHRRGPLPQRGQPHTRPLAVPAVTHPQ
jgi:hypothetical protein